MTNRINALFVVLNEDTREDDIEGLVAAIKQMRNVLDVTANKVNPVDFVAEKRVKADIWSKVIKLFE